MHTSCLCLLRFLRSQKLQTPQVSDNVLTCQLRKPLNQRTRTSKHKGANILADKEGRILGMEIAGKKIVSAYFPADPRKKIGMFGNLAAWLGNRNCIVCGDFNTVSADIDYHRCFSGRENCRAMDKGMMASLKDVIHLNDPYRDLYPLSRAYTYWPYTNRCRERDIGMRIDYTFLSEDIPVVGAEILGGVMGSDHCPVTLTLAD